MKTFTIDDIRSWSPCYDPTKYLPEGWQGTAVDVLRNEAIPFQDRLWCVLRTAVTSERVMRLFAVWSYRQTLVFIQNPDPRSIECANVAERFANGEATEAELNAARYAARSAAWYAAESAEYAARSAAESAESAAWYAARSAAWYAARSAARSAESAAESARLAAWSAAESAQRDKLIEMIEAEDKEKTNV